MPIYSFPIRAWIDEDWSAAEEVGEMPLQSVSVSAYEGTSLVGTGATLADGNGSVFVMSAADPGTFTLVATNPNTVLYRNTTPLIVVRVASSLVAPALAAFGFATTPPPRQCFRPASSWVWEVCWVPASGGVAVTLHHRGRPYFRCLYPGTTYDDYLLWLLAPSAGRHLRARFYRRPFIPLPLGG